MQTELTTIYVNKDYTPKTIRYNGSWHIIKHESVDSLDYSIQIWDAIYEAQEFFLGDYEDEPTASELERVFVDACVNTMEMYEDIGVKIVVE